MSDTLLPLVLSERHGLVSRILRERSCPTRGEPYTVTKMPSKMENALERLKEIPDEVQKKLQNGTDEFAGFMRSASARLRGEGSEDAPVPMHLVPEDGGWALIDQGADTPTHIFETKDEAVSSGRSSAQEKETVLVIHRKDGTVQEVRNYR